MSDERDGAGSPDDTTENEATGDTRGQTAVVTRPARPTGKRSRRGTVSETDAEDTDSPGETGTSVIKDGAGTAKKKTARKEPGSKRNPLLYIWNYLQQVVAELRKVIWPNRKQMVSYTTVVLIFLAFMVALIAGVDLGLARLIGLVFGA